MTASASRIDIPQQSWIDRLLPRPLRPYARLMRLDRPIGFWLLLIPGWWAITLAGRGEPNTTLMILFLVGAVLMRGAGCTINDIVDRDIDAKVARTRTRPIPAGEVSVRAAIIFQRTMGHLNETALGDESSNDSEHSDSTEMVMSTRLISRSARAARSPLRSCSVWTGSSTCAPSGARKNAARASRAASVKSEKLNIQVR